MRIILSDTFSDGSSFYVACVCNHYDCMSHNCRSKMSLTNHFPCFYDAFYFNCVSFSAMTSLTMIFSMKSLTMMVIGPSYLVNALFHFLKIPLVLSVESSHLVGHWNIFI